VGDPQYGGARMPLVIGRPFLHAGRLVFDHPLTGESLEFNSELPADLEVVLKRCRAEK
jgi:23S rRNA pseudouridine1911/1915/1917 synthase